MEEAEYTSGRFTSSYLPPVTVLLGENNAFSPRPPSPEVPTYYIPHFPGAIADDDMYRHGNQGPPTTTTGATSSSSSGNMALNVHLAVPQQEQTAAAGADGSHTPNTPEILASIVSMQSGAGPFSSYASPAEATAALASTGREITASTSCVTSPTSTLISPSSECASSPASSLASTPSSAMSVQHYRSQFIKEGLKLKVKQKLGGRCEPTATVTSAAVPTDPAGPSPTSSTRSRHDSHTSVDSMPESKVKVKEELTEEDEVRRMRRRERNKIAATKCRNKKKARTVLLVKESETLESQNIHLKTEIAKLEGEKRRLMEILQSHEGACNAKRAKVEPKAEPEEESQYEVPYQEPLLHTSSTTSAATMTSRSLSSVQSQQQQQQQQGIFYPQQQQQQQRYEAPTPQLFLNDGPMFDEEVDASAAAVMALVGGVSCGLADNTASVDGNQVADGDPQQDHFLAKRPLGFAAFLDMGVAL